MHFPVGGRLQAKGYMGYKNRLRRVRLYHQVHRNKLHDMGGGGIDYFLLFKNKR